MGGISSRGQLVTQIDRRSGIHPLCSSVTTGQEEREREGIKETTQRLMEISPPSSDLCPFGDVACNTGSQEGKLTGSDVGTR